VASLLLVCGVTAALGAAAALLAPALALRVPVGRLYFAGLVAAFVFLVSLLVGLVARGVDISPTWVAPGAGALAAVLVIGLSLEQLMPLRRVQRVAERMAREGTSAQARDELLHELRRQRPRSERQRRVHAVLVLSVVGALAEARLWDEALLLLEELSDEGLTPSLVATRAASLATCRLYAGDREGARAALSTVMRPAPYPLTEQVLASSGALLEALEGDGQAALNILEEVTPPGEPRVERAVGVARAHALAALGDELEARRVLTELRRDHGDGALIRVQSLSGPASPLAAALLNEAESPYRG